LRIWRLETRFFADGDTTECFPVVHDHYIIVNPRAAVPEWDEASAWAEIWVLASASASPLAWQSL